PFHWATKRLALRQVACHVTYTTPATHDVVRANFDRSPLYSGVIDATGVRYCPSIEDKVKRFAERERHQVILEPDGLDTEEVYANGISTSLPVDAQEALVRSIPGLERAEIMRPGYAIEYDFVHPTQLAPTLECRAAPGPVPGGEDQRHHGLRGGGGAGAVGGRDRRQRRARARAVHARSLRMLHGSAGRRPGDPGHARAVSHVHLARRVPAVASRGQRRSAPLAVRLPAGPGVARAARGGPAPPRATGGRGAAA